MNSTEKEVLNRIESAQGRGQHTFVETFEEELHEPVTKLGEDVLAKPSADRVAGWLRVFAKLADISLEGPADITAKLRDQHRAIFEEALASLNPGDRSVIDEFAASLDQPDLEIEAFEVAPKGPVIESADLGPVLARFTVTKNFDGSRRRVWAGTLLVFDRDQNRVGEYAAQTGGFVADFRQRNGPTPPGTYKVSNYRPNRFNAPGMVRDGVAFSFDLDETDGTSVFNRSALRIHPDQNPAGTHGCIGLAANATVLRDCAAKLEKNLKEVGPFRLVVKYGAQGGEV